MQKLQDELRKIINQFEFIKRISYYDNIFLFIYPLYRIIILPNFRFIYVLRRFGLLMQLIFVIGILFSLANNKIKEVMLSTAVITILSVLNLLSGNFGSIIYAAIFGFITFYCYKALNIQNEPITANVKVCPNCKAEYKEDVSFCTNCGQKLDWYLKY